MASISLQTARTQVPDPIAAADDLVKQLGDHPSKLVVLFASHDRDQVALNRALRDRLPKGTRLIGSTTGGEIDNQGIHHGSALLASLGGDFEVGLGLGRGLSSDAIKAGSSAVDQACSELGVRPQDLDETQYVGLVMDDPFRYKKEELLLGMLEKNGALILVGGGASDPEMDPAKQVAYLHVDGEVTTDSAFIALFRTQAPWAALRSHWYEPTGKMIRITKVDPTHQLAIEIDGQPAAPRYAEILGVGVEDLAYALPKGFAASPTALKVGREYFLRSPFVVEGTAIRYVNLLEEGAELEVMRLTDMAGSTRRFFQEEIPRRVSHPTAALFFHCGGRLWFAAAQGKLGDLAETFKDAPPCAGLNVYFETYCGFNINSTLTALVFGSDA